MFGLFVEVEIHFGDVGAVVAGERGVEAEAGEVKAAVAAGLGVVAGGVGFQDVEHGGGDADAGGVDEAGFGGGEGLNGAGVGAELDDALLVSIGGDGPELGGGGAVLAIFPIEEEEGAVPDDVAAEGGSVLVPDEIFAFEAGAVGEPVVGGGGLVAMELVERSMPLVGAGLSD